MTKLAVTTLTTMTPGAGTSPLVARVALAALAVLAAPASAADLLVGPGQAYTQIDAAIAAASPGDRIFVETGTYAAFTLNKALEVRGMGPGPVRVTGFNPGEFSQITNIQTGDVATLAGLQFFYGIGFPVFGIPLLDVTDNPGTVVLRGVDLGVEAFGGIVSAAITAKDTSRLLVQGCEIRGGNGIYLGSIGFSAIEASNVSLSVTDSNLYAGNASFGQGTSGPSGAPALEVLNCELRLACSGAVGGKGGFDAFKGSSQTGGAAVELWSSTLVLTGGPANQLLGGKGGAGGVPFSGPGGPALRLVWNSTAEVAADALLQGGVEGSGSQVAASLDIEAGSMLTPLAWRLPALVPTPGEVTLGSPFALELSGEPGAAVVCVLSPKLGPALPIVGVDGIVHVDLTAWSALPFVLLDGQGLGSVPLAVPLQPGLAGAHLWFQSVAIAGLAARLSNAARFGIAP